MKINLIPVEGDQPLTAAVKGSYISINGESFNFSDLKDGGMIRTSEVGSTLFMGPVVRHDDGELEITLGLPCPPGASENMRFPEPLYVKSGSVPFPQNVPVPEPEPVQDEPADD